MPLQQKITSNFIGKAVRKDLVSLLKGSLDFYVPTYILEHSLGKYCQTDDEESLKQGVENAKQFLLKNYVFPTEAEALKKTIRESGSCCVIDCISVQLNKIKNEYQAEFTNLGLTNIPIDDLYIKTNPKLLSEYGEWCIITIGYEEKTEHWSIQSLEAIRISNVNIEDYIERRKHFSTHEWIDLMMHTIGIDPAPMSRREKLITIARLTPYVEHNFNFIELGISTTGKSYMFDEFSPYSILGSFDMTVENLFVTMCPNKDVLGFVNYGDVVAWDDFDHSMASGVDSELKQLIKMYCFDGSYRYGEIPHKASASMVFIGCSEYSDPYTKKNNHHLECLPTAFLDASFLINIHLYNPGWEIKRLTRNSFSKGYGLTSDYMAAVLHIMRDIDYVKLMKNYAEFDKTISLHDYIAVSKTFSGLLKLIYPDRNCTDEEAFELIDFAIECRIRLKEQISVIEETYEFLPSTFEYVNVKTGNKVAPISVKPTISVEIKQMVKKVLKNGMEKKEYGVEFCVSGDKIPVLFGGKERIMVYMCTLLRQKMGERMYLHEFYKNSKGGNCRIKRGMSRPWIEAVYYTLFPSVDKDFDKWIGKIDLPIEDKDRGRPVNVGKTQANNEVRKALKGMEQEIIDNCIINTIEDNLLDTYYSINIAPANIIVAPELEFLFEDFYDIFGKERARGQHIINE